jgi:hypothetical protein
MLDIQTKSDTAYNATSGSTEIASTSEFKTMKSPQLEMDTNERQRKYVEKQKNMGGTGLGVVFQDAFIRGMRDIGYKDPAWAMAEMLDNSIQASANSIEVRFGFGSQNKSQAKNPEAIALIDNGAGMIPEMISYAVRWGGTDRENDRHGFGRFGYGLPSSAVSIASRYTVYSKTKNNGWHSVTIDLQELAAASNSIDQTAELLKPKPVSLPLWLQINPENGIDVNSLESGTIVVLEELDRLGKLPGWVLVKSLKSKLLDHFGLIYRHWMPSIQIVVDGTICESVDPLFLLPHGRFYEETSILAKKVSASTFEVDAPDGRKATVRIRAALLHPQFGWATPEDLTSKTKRNKRWTQVLQPSKHGLNGLLLCREGRQIDVITPEWTKFQNDDVYIKIEIDFDPALDEVFGVTTSKQQIVINDSMWDKLKASGKESGNLINLVQEMRAEYKALNKVLKAATDSLATKKKEKLPSAEAMIAAEKHKTRTPHLSDEKREEAANNLAAKVVEDVKATGKSEEVKALIQESITRRPWDIEFKAIEEGPFYQAKRLGEQKLIVINTAHPFYSRVYDQAENVRSAIEVMLFVMADGEIDAEGSRLQFYKAERNYWSEMMRIALENLESESEVSDREASISEIDELSIENIKDI